MSFGVGNMVFWLAVIVLIAIFIGLFIDWGNDLGFDGLFDCIMVTLMGALFGSLGAAAVFFGGTAIANLTLTHHDHYKRVSLVAIRDNAGFAGSFVWGSGAIGSTGNYMFYYQDDNGAKRLANIGGSHVNLYEDSKDGWAIEFAGCDLSWDWIAPCYNNGPRFVEIHVPQGSVKTGVDLSLNGAMK